MVTIYVNNKNRYVILCCLHLFFRAFHVEKAGIVLIDLQQLFSVSFDSFIFLGA